jgi:putative membrane protein
MAYQYLWPEIPPNTAMLLHLIVNWFLSALAIWLIARLLPGIEVRDFSAALIAAAALAVVDFFLGSILRLLALPLIWITLGLFTWIIKAVVLKVTSMFTPGFIVRGFLPALAGALLLTVLTFVLRAVVYA